MEISNRIEGDTLVLSLNGRLDAASATTLDRDWVLDGQRHVLVDLGECNYVSSAGLRIFLRLKRETTAKGASLTLVNVGAAVNEVLDLTGLNKLLSVRRKAREISIDGLELLSAGVCGQCFRLDPETIVKLYNEGVAPDVAEQEKEFARAALVAGIPTALSYEVVTCGNRTGVVYEMLDAELFSAIIRREPDGVDRHGPRLAQIARNIHSKRGDPAVFPDLKVRLRACIEGVRGLFADEDIAHLAARLETIPDADTLVHFDLHTSNIMIRAGEAVIIDMGDLSRGHYFFDIGVIAMIYGYEESGSCEFATRIPNSTGRALYEKFIAAYFADRPVAEFEFFRRNEAFLASLRLIHAVTFLPLAKDILVAKIRDVFLPLIRAEGGLV
ncbi:MAG: anti-sigma factor antagonist [Pseudomonadota bacterium]